jgi:hypothetical protein
LLIFAHLGILSSAQSTGDVMSVVLLGASFKLYVGGAPALWVAIGANQWIQSHRLVDDIMWRASTTP